MSAHFCAICGARCWHLKGTDVDTCRRGHHHPCVGTECPDAPDASSVVVRRLDVEYLKGAA